MYKLQKLFSKALRLKDDLLLWSGTDGAEKYRSPFRCSNVLAFPRVEVAGGNKCKYCTLVPRFNPTTPDTYVTNHYTDALLGSCQIEASVNTLSVWNHVQSDSCLRRTLTILCGYIVLITGVLTYDSWNCVGNVTPVINNNISITKFCMTWASNSFVAWYT